MTRSQKNILTRVRKHFPQVERIVDSNRSIEIHVTKADAAKAKKKDPENCAMAQACIREKHVDGTIIGISKSYLIKGNRAIRFQTPQSVAREITAFDRKSDFEPGTYRLSKLSPSGKMNQKYKRRVGTTHGNGPKPLKVHRTENVRVISKK